MRNPLVSFVTLNMNRKDDVAALIRSIKRQRYKNIEIIVVDNASTDGSVEYLKKTFPEILVIARKVGKGYPSYSLGLRKAKGDFIIVLDSDTEVKPSIAEKVIKTFNENPDVAVVAFHIENFKGRSVQVQIVPRERKENKVHGQKALSYCGTGWAIRKGVFQKVGDFNEQYFLCANEYEWSIRALEKGFDIRYFPDLVVYHKGGVSYEKSTGKFGYYTVRNWIWYLLEFVPFPTILKMIPFHLRVARDRSQVNARLPKYYIMGILVGLLYAPKYVMRRRRVSAETAFRIESGLLSKNGWIYEWEYQSH